MKNMFKNITKKVVIGIGSLLLACGLNAATVTGTYNLAATNSLISSNGVVINSITVANAGTNVLYIKFFDTPLTNLLVTSATGYTNYTVSTISVTNIYTNINSVLETNIYTAITNVANEVPGFTNSRPVLLTLAVPTNTTYTYTPASYLYAFQGIATTNNTCGASSTVTIDYSPFK